MTQVHFNIRFVVDGDRYGLRDCLTHSGETMIEFYDSRYCGPRFTEHGQFVSRYTVSTLLEARARLESAGLCLDGGIPSWNVDPAQMRAVFVAIDQHTANRAAF